MKTIGLLGGMSWESTVHYYQIINEEVKNKLGGLHSAKIILYSVEFAEIENYQSSNQWEKCGGVFFLFTSFTHSCLSFLMVADFRESRNIFSEQNTKYCIIRVD